MMSHILLNSVVIKNQKKKEKNMFFPKIYQFALWILPGKYLMPLVYVTHLEGTQCDIVTASKY